MLTILKLHDVLYMYEVTMKECIVCLLQLMFGVCVMFALFVPSRVISFLFPSFLPFNLTIARFCNITSLVLNYCMCT